MIVKYRSWEMNIDISSFSTLVIENPLSYRQFVSSLWRQANKEPGDIYLFDGTDEKDFHKVFFFVPSPFANDMNEKRILNALYQSIEEEVNQSHWQSFQELQRCQSEFLGKVSVHHPVQIHWEQNPPVKDFLKYMKLGFEAWDEELLAAWYQYIKTVQEYLQPTAIAVIGLRSCLTEEELEQFVHEMELLELPILTIERWHVGNPVPGEKIYIIDKDLCEIY